LLTSSAAAYAVGAASGRRQRPLAGELSDSELVEPDTPEQFVTDVDHTAPGRPVADGAGLPLFLTCPFGHFTWSWRSHVDGLPE